MTKKGKKAIVYPSQTIRLKKGKDMKTKEIINEVYYKLVKVLESKDWGSYPSKLEKLCLKSEKAHRRGAPVDKRSKESVNVAARYFCCQYILEGMKQRVNYKISPKDLLWTRMEYLLGVGIGLEYQEELKKEFKEFDLQKFEELEYDRDIA